MLDADGPQVPGGDELGGEPLTPVGGLAAAARAVEAGPAGGRLCDRLAALEA